MPRTLLIAGLLAAAAAARAGQPVPLRVAIHVDTSISHSFRAIKIAGITVRKKVGTLPPTLEEIAAIAPKYGLDAVILADRARADVSYGLTPFSRLFKVTVSEGSIASYGAPRYVERVKKAELASGTLFILGAECIPYYRWNGDPITGLQLSHLYEHMVIAGLGSPEDLEQIPDTAAGWGYRFEWTAGLNLLLLILMLAGIKLWRLKPTPRRRLGALLFLAAALALVDGAPYLPRKIWAYQAPRSNPAEILTDYARSKNALTFWAHPDANPGSLPHRLQQENGVEVQVGPYPELLYQTKGYTGFAMFNAGSGPGEPGEAWDQALEQYCKGTRDRPVWVVSECDFDTGSPDNWLAEAQTVVWAAERSKKAILDALRNGRCYATRIDIHKGLSVSDYLLRSGDLVARSGETLVTPAPAATLDLRFGAKFPRQAAARLAVTAIVNGVPQHLPLTVTPDGRGLRATGAIGVPPTRKTSYVRVLVYDGREPILALNPIFLAPEGGP